MPNHCYFILNEPFLVGIRTFFEGIEGLEGDPVINGSQLNSQNIIRTCEAPHATNRTEAQLALFQ